MKRARWILTVLMCLTALILGLTSCGEVVECKVDFIVDGEVYSSLNTNGEETIKMPSNPQKEGYTFDGWYWDNGMWQKPFTANSLLDAPLSDNMAVYAKFLEIHEHSYSTEWSSDATNHWHAAICEHSTEIKDQAAHTFGSWSVKTAASCGGAGVEHRFCTVCNYEEARNVDKVDHTPVVTS